MSAPLPEPWPLCELHGQAVGACLPCHRHELAQEAMPRWAWRLHVSLLTSISLGCAHLAAAQARKLGSVARAAEARISVGRQMALATYVLCERCGKDKKPLGRSAPLEMASGLCDDGCPGYREEPKPDCRWPGEETCGPGCTRGEL